MCDHTDYAPGCEDCHRDGDEVAAWNDLRSHVSRLEESLRVALEERAEAVEVLREVDEWSMSEFSYCPICKDHRHAPDCRLARAIGKGG